MGLRAYLALSGLIFAVSCGGVSAEGIPYRRNVTLKVGETVVLKGVRGDCGAPPPSWSQLSSSLPPTALGRFSDGGPGEVSSKSCKGTTPARAVRFTATQKGSETLLIFEDKVSVTVQ